MLKKKSIKFYKDFRNTIKDAIKDDIGVQKISIPDTFGEPDEGRKNMTVNTWLSFYKTK